MSRMRSYSHSCAGKNKIFYSQWGTFKSHIKDDYKMFKSNAHILELFQFLFCQILFCPSNLILSIHQYLGTNADLHLFSGILIVSSYNPHQNMPCTLPQAQVIHGTPGDPISVKLLFAISMKFSIYVFCNPGTLYIDIAPQPCNNNCY